MTALTAALGFDLGPILVEHDPADLILALIPAEANLSILSFPVQAAGIVLGQRGQRGQRRSDSVVDRAMQGGGGHHVEGRGEAHQDQRECPEE